jgi:cytochrome P450
VQEVKSSYPVDEIFDPLSKDYREGPYPYYVRFRREAPVFFAPEINVWVVSRYEDILNIVRSRDPLERPGAKASPAVGARLPAPVPRVLSTSSPASLAESVFLKAREP